MTDHFATLGQPRRPWLDADSLKDVFHAQSAALHPDVPGTGDAERFAALNAAYSVLREPASRLRHLLELCAPATLAAAAPPPAELADQFMTIAGLRHRLTDFLARRKAATSPLAVALLAGDSGALRRELHTTLAQLEAAEASTLAEVRALDTAWREEDAGTLTGIFHRLSYLARWLAQTRESLFTLGT